MCKSGNVVASPSQVSLSLKMSNSASNSKVRTRGRTAWSRTRSPGTCCPVSNKKLQVHKRGSYVYERVRFFQLQEAKVSDPLDSGSWARGPKLCGWGRIKLYIRRLRKRGKERVAIGNAESEISVYFLNLDAYRGQQLEFGAWAPRRPHVHVVVWLASSMITTSSKAGESLSPARRARLEIVIEYKFSATRTRLHFSKSHGVVGRKHTWRP